MSANSQAKKVYTSDPLAAIRELDNKLDSCMSSFEARMTNASPTSMEQLAAEVKQFKVCMKLAIDLVRTQMTQVTALVDDAENRSRRKFLIFRGIEEKQEENLSEVITAVVKDTLKMSDFMPSNIRFSYRLGRETAQVGPRPVLVRFYDLDTRSSVWRSKKNFKGTGISVAEYLTATRRSIFNEGRRVYGVNKCWSQDGNVYLLSSNGTKHRVVSQAQLEGIIKKFPSNKETSVAASGSPATTVGASVSAKGAPAPAPARSKTGRFVRAK